MNEIDDKLDEKELQVIAALREVNTILTPEQQEQEWYDCYKTMLIENLKRKEQQARASGNMTEVTQLITKIAKIKSTKSTDLKVEDK